MRNTLKISINDSEIFLEDISAPTDKMNVTDFSRSIFPSLHEIDKLRTEIQQNV